MLSGDRKTPPSDRRILIPALVGLLCGCSPGHLESFPSLVRPGVEVPQADYRLADAVEEYVSFRNLPVSPQQMRTGVVTTEWFEVHGLEVKPTPLAECPGPPPTEQELEPDYRARYRFSILPRASLRLFRVEAHWQKELRTTDPDQPSWIDCRSTGAWEREAEDRIILRARLLSHQYRTRE